MNSNRKHLFSGLAIGVGLTAIAGILMGQSASQPIKSAAEYYVTADGEGAHLWVREGVNLRVVGHGECKECKEKGHDHKDGDGHDHGKPAAPVPTPVPKK
ncbi:MAG: hypothetical protein ACREJO_01020 [Phycisphaerales bacterium]